MSLALRIPFSIRLPFGYIVKVRQVTREDLAILTNDPDPGYAAWVSDTRTIYLTKNRPLKKKRADLAHEVGHAWIDWQAWILNSPFADPRN